MRIRYLPLRDIVVFPHMIVPLFVGREKSIRALEEVMRNDALIMLATQKNASDDDPSPESIYETGTLASVLQLLKLPDGTVKVLVEGLERARVQKYSDRAEYYEATAIALADTDATSVEAEALARSVVSDFESYVKLNKKISAEVVGVVQAINRFRKTRRHCGLTSRRQDFRPPGYPRDAVRHGAAREGARPDGERNLGAAGREANPFACQASDGEDPARVLSQRADEGDPEGTRRRRRPRRTGRSGREDCQDQALQGSAREGAARVEEAAPDVADVRGGDRGAQLSRLAVVDTVEQEVEGQEGSGRSPDHTRQRSLRT